jgi:transcription antitermination factor NusG
VKRRWSDRTKQMNVPLFPGYVFCRLDEQNRLPVLTTPGVIRIIGNGKRPVPITESEIESVKSVLKSNLDCMPWPTLAPGSRITVDRGPLMGVQGVLVKCRNENRLVVSVELLNRAVAVEIDDTWIRPSASEVSSLPRLT